VLVPTLPKDLTDLVNKMLSQDRDDRPQSLQEVRGALARYADVSVRSFAEPARASRRSLPTDKLTESGHRVLVRSSDDVSPLAVTEQRPSGSSLAPKRSSSATAKAEPPPETLSPSSAAAQSTADVPPPPASKRGW